MDKELLKVQEGFNKISVEYNESYESELQLLNEINYSILNACVPDGQQLNIIDAGCGNCYFSIFLAQKGHYITAVDISDKLLEHGKKKIKANNLDNVNVIQCDIAHMSFAADETYDFVLCEGSVLSYTPSFDNTVSEIYRILKKGSRTLLTIQNKMHFMKKANRHTFSAKILCTNRLPPFFEPCAVGSFCLFIDEFEERIKQAGFKVLRIGSKPIYLELSTPVKDKAQFDWLLQLERSFIFNRYYAGLGRTLYMLCEKI